LKRLKTILHCNGLFYLLCIITVVLTLIRIEIDIPNSYDLDTKKVVGEVLEYDIDGDYLKLTIDANEKLIGRYYFKTKAEKELFIKSVDVYDTLRLDGELEEAEGSKDIYSFDYKQYLKSKNINYIIKIDKITLISKEKSFFKGIKCFLLKRNSNPYIKAFIFGNNKSIITDVMSSYQEIGISHLFAISGMHVGLLTLVISKLLMKLNIKEKYIFIIISLFLFFYLFITGVSPSILRAIFFYLFFSINKIYNFNIKGVNIFLLIFSISLLVNPYYIHEVSFLYSYTISFSILLVGNKINNGSYFKRLFLTSLISFIVSFPITIYFFNQINILSVFYNMLFVPFISMIVFPLSIITYIIPFFEPIFNVFISLMEFLALKFNSISFSKLIFPSLPRYYYILYIVGVVIFIYFYNKKIISVLPILLLALFNYLYPVFFNQNYLMFLDVGQGDSILIHSKDKTMLVDTGGVINYSREKWQERKNKKSLTNYVTIPVLKKLGIRKIDYLVLTHGDFDHMGEALKLIKQYRVEDIYLNQGNFNLLEKKVIKKYRHVYQIREKEEIVLGNINIVQINKEFSDENDSSSILLMCYKNKKILLTGDASKKSEEYILNKYNIGKIDVLKIGHHGSITSTSDELLKELRPSLAIISCGKNNRFNHPHKETIDKLKEYRIKYLRTDISGTIRIDL
jgi:DNA internalization competence protein ComEC/Rec2-like protein